MTLTAVHAGAHLHHVAFESADPEHLARFYAEAMDMRLERIDGDEWRCEGPARRFIARRGAARQLAFAGLACRDADGLAALRARAEAEGLAIEPSPSPYFRDGAFGVRDPDGNLVCFGLARPQGDGFTGLHAPTQHLTFASFDVEAFRAFYCDRLGVDHHSYEAGTWNGIRDWCDRFGGLGIELMWGPGRHGPGNNLFAFIADPDGNWIEISAELEVIHDRPSKDWPQEPRTLNLWGRAIMRS